MTARPALSVRNLTKHYGAHVVLSDMSFELRPGETAALLGENGAGKSTAAKILAGAIDRDGGEITVGGRPVRLGTPRAALDEGIAFIPQELVHVPQLTVAENLCIGRWPRRGPWTSMAAVRRQAASDCAEFGIDLPLDRSMAELTLAQQQLAEILKALTRRSRLIVLDEPTAALSNHDAEILLARMTKLADHGVSVLYISHRLDEVFRVCDTVHVLRNGRLVHSGPVSETTPGEVVEHMLGQAPQDRPTRAGAADDQVIALAVESMARNELPELHDVTFRLHAGEILGIYGVRGSGAEAVAEALGGVGNGTTMEGTVGGTPLAGLRSPRASRRAGIAHIPADRKSQGLALTLSGTESLSLRVLPTVSRWAVLSMRRELRVARDLARRVKLRNARLAQPVGQLSGGNQQKILLGSRIAERPPVLVLQEPTRGVDVGARLELHRLLIELAGAGAGLLLVTSDLDEIVSLSDRLLVMRAGRIVRCIEHPGLHSRTEVLTAAGGLP